MRNDCTCSCFDGDPSHRRLKISNTTACNYKNNPVTTGHTRDMIWGGRDLHVICFGGFLHVGDSKYNILLLTTIKSGYRSCMRHVVVGWVRVAHAVVSMGGPTPRRFQIYL